MAITRKKKSKSVYAPAPIEEKVGSHTLALLVDNEPGVLARVVGMISGRGYNIDSLNVTETIHDKRLSRITVVCSGTPIVIEQIKKQLGRLIPTRNILDMTTFGPHVERELALVKVVGNGSDRIEALRIADIFRAKVVDSTLNSFIFELTGTCDKIDAFVDLMQPIGLIDVCRTGVAAITRGDISVGD